MNKYHVYVYLDTRKKGEYKYANYVFEYEPFYVGRGIRYRYKEHTKETKQNTKNTPKLNKIHKIKKETGTDPFIDIRFKGLTKEEADHYEKELIHLIGRACDGQGPLLNLTLGGDGGDTFTNNPNKEQIRLLRKIMPSNRKGVKLSKETKDKISKNKKGIPWGNHSEDTKLKMSLISKGKPKSKEHKEALKKAWAKRKAEGRGTNPHSEETKRKIGKGNTGKVASQATKEKLSKAHMGRKHTQKAKDKIRKASKEMWKRIKGETNGNN